jgi:RNA polymerase sporulation-specific sigma factor
VILPPHPTDPQDLLVTREEQLFMEEKMEELLSDLERKVLRLYLDGRSYQEISDDLDRHVKSIDNALQRVKKKFERHVDVKTLTS